MIRFVSYSVLDVSGEIQMRMRGFDFVRSCTCNTVFELLACFITVVLFYVLFCYFNDLI